MTRIGFATYEGIPELTEDDRLATEALRQRGADVVPVVWSEPATDGLAAVVVRSCWDYHLAPERFAGWAESVERSGGRLLNPAGVVRWNLHKSYLRELEAKGVALPRTVWLDRGSSANLPELLQEEGMERAVVKPSVSLTAFETWRTSRSEAEGHQRRFEALIAERDVLVQAYLSEVESGGELSFIFLGGAYSHTVRKRPRPGDFRVQSDYGGTVEAVAPSTSLVEQAQRVVALMDEPLLYARVDGLDVGGRLVLMELELIDPVLFLACDRAAPARFADALVHMLET